MKKKLQRKPKWKKNAEEAMDRLKETANELMEKLDEWDDSLK